MPSSVGLPWKIHSTIFQPRAAAQAPIMVFSSAMAARPFAALADPALKPIQPTNSKEAPIITRTRLLPVIGSEP